MEVIVRTSLDGQPFVEERLEPIVEEVIVVAIFFLKQAAQEVFRPFAPRCPSRHAQPSLLLHEIEEDDLAEEFLCKALRSEAATLELVPDVLPFAYQIVQIFLEGEVVLLVLLEELLCYPLNTECTFDLRDCWETIGDEKLNELPLCCVGWFGFTHKEGVTPCGC